MPDEGRTNCCPKCGGNMIGDNYTTAVHCEFAELPDGIEADGGPVYCDFEEVKEEYLLCDECHERPAKHFKAYKPWLCDACFQRRVPNQ